MLITENTFGKAAPDPLITLNDEVIWQQLASQNRRIKKNFYKLKVDLFIVFVFGLNKGRKIFHRMSFFQRIIDASTSGILPECQMHACADEDSTVRYEGDDDLDEESETSSENDASALADGDNGSHKDTDDALFNLTEDDLKVILADSFKQFSLY